MEKLDLFIVNSTILTLDEDDSVAGSLAVKGGRIVRIWSEKQPPADILALNTDAEILDLKGNTLIPGFVDTHNHILTYSLNLARVDCGSPLNKSIEEILQKLSNKAAQTPEGEWIFGYGYDDTLLQDKRHPNRYDLDKVSDKHPIMIHHTSGHLSVVNSKAIELAKVTENTPVGTGGYFGLDENGKLNGVLYERPAMEFFYAVQEKDTEETLLKRLGMAAQNYMAEGITTNTDAGVGLRVGEVEFDIHIKAAQQGLNPMRTKLMILHTLLRDGGKFAGYSADRLDAYIKQLTNGLVELDSAKMFQDGSIQGLTGALREPYYSDSSITGNLFHEQSAFNEEILELHKRGFRIAIHGNGDNAIGSILDAFEYALDKSPRDDHRHRIEHVQTATTADLDRMQKLGVAGSFFINHVYYWGDRHENIFLGPKRASRISPLADAVERDLLLTLHSDCPITPISPLFSVWAAVNRITRDGKILGPEQRIDVITALKAMTIYGAKLAFMEDKIGSIETGKLADFAVLDRDPTNVNPEEIKDIEILQTIIGGGTVYKKSKVYN
jgi:predicted amidohydrolase YtcJ